MTILVLNCGSSSIKYQVIKMSCANEYSLLVKGQIERIGLSDGLLVHKPVDKPKFELTKSIPDHTFRHQPDPRSTGGSRSRRIEQHYRTVGPSDTAWRMAANISRTARSSTKPSNSRSRLASNWPPCTIRANLKGILSMENILPNTPQVAVFDTSFHQTIPGQKLHVCPSL